MEFSEPMGPTDYSVLVGQVGVCGGVGAGPGHVTFYVQAADVEAALEKAESLGGTRMIGPRRGARSRDRDRLFSDREGDVIGLTSLQAS